MPNNSHEVPHRELATSSQQAPLQQDLVVTARRTVSLVVPMFNEGDGIALLYRTLCPIFEQVPDIDFEVVCVDDGSSDDTLAKLIACATADRRFKVIELSRNFGKEAAMTAGIDEATGDAIIPMDADLQDPPELIPVMIKAWLNGAEVVLARRANRNSDPFLKRQTAKFFYHFHNQFSSIQIPKNVGDFRLMDRVVVDALKQLPEHHRFMKGLFAWVGFKTVTIDYVRQSRATGGTKFSGWKLWNFALEGFTSFSTVPLKFWSYVGVVGALSTFIYAAVIIARTLIWGVDVPGYASLLVAILFFGSLQLISVGVLGEYIGRIYTETKNRPVYLIRKRY